MNSQYRHLNDILSSLTGLNIQQTSRIPLSKELKKIINDQLSISEIAYELDFEFAIFHRLFKANTSILPLEFGKSFS